MTLSTLGDDDKGEDLLMTLTTTGNYLVTTHDNNTNNPCDNNDL